MPSNGQSSTSFSSASHTKEHLSSPPFVILDLGEDDKPSTHGSHAGPPLAPPVRELTAIARAILSQNDLEVVLIVDNRERKGHGHHRETFAKPLSQVIP